MSDLLDFSDVLDGLETELNVTEGDHIPGMGGEEKAGYGMSIGVGVGVVVLSYFRRSSISSRGPTSDFLAW